MRQNPCKPSTWMLLSISLVMDACLVCCVKLPTFYLGCSTWIVSFISKEIMPLSTAAANILAICF